MLRFLSSLFRGCLHFYSFNFYTPRISGLIQARLHDMGNGLTLGENLGQVLGPQHVPQGGGGQQLGGVAGK